MVNGHYYTIATSRLNTLNMRKTGRSIFRHYQLWTQGKYIITRVIEVTKQYNQPFNYCVSVVMKALQAKAMGKLLTMYLIIYAKGAGNSMGNHVTGMQLI